MTHRIYFAAPMFAESELRYNAHAVSQIRKNFPEVHVYLPQEQDNINDKTAFADAALIAKTDTDNLLACDTIIAILDGLVVDPGVASEIGVAYQAGLNILGLFTDSRTQGATNQAKLDALQDLAESQFAYVNLYTAGLIKEKGKIVSSLDDILVELADLLA